MSNELIKTKNLKKYFSTPQGMLHAVDDVNISINSRETLGVVGESGCGKSTLGRTMIRLHDATSGQILLDGNNIITLKGKELRDLSLKMQIIFQDPYSSLDPRMTVGQIIGEPLRIHKIYDSRKDEQDKILNLMNTVGISKRLLNSYPHELDGGRRQRIGIARALALSPKFIVCDEPVSALDVSIQAQILNLLINLQDNEGLTYMFITHDLSVVKHISNNIAVMYLGQCIEIASANNLFRNPVHPYTRVLLSAIPVPNLSRRGCQRQIIRGEVISPIDPKPGCRFYSRCEYARAYCNEFTPVLTEIKNDHFVACYRWAEI